MQAGEQMLAPPTAPQPPRSAGAYAGLSGSVVYGTAGVASLVALWSLAVWLQWLPKDFLPSPWSVVDKFIAFAISEPFSGDLLPAHAWASLQKFALSYAVAVAAGVPLGMLLAQSRAARTILMPVFDAIRFIPPIAWVPFSILWFGTGLLAPTWIVFVAVFPPCVWNTYRGVMSIDRSLKEAALTMGAGRMLFAREVVLPGALPEIVAGMRIGAGLGWQSLVGAELIVGGTGLGYVMTQGQQNLDTSTLVVCMLSIGAIGAALDYVLRAIEMRLRGKWGQS